MSELWKQKINEEVSRMFEMNIVRTDDDGVKEQFKMISDHMKQTAENTQLLIELDRQKGYNQYIGVDPEIAWIAGRLHDLADLDEGKPGYNRWDRSDHVKRSVKYASQLLDSIGYNKVEPKKTQKILEIIGIHDVYESIEDLDNETTVVVEGDALWKYSAKGIAPTKKIVERRFSKKFKSDAEYIEGLRERKKKWFKTRIGNEIADQYLADATAK